MDQITLRLSRDMLESLEGEATDRDKSRSEYIRDVLESRHSADELRDEYETQIHELRDEHAEEVDELRAEHEREVDELRARIEELETEVERLQNEKQTLIRDREEKQELARFAETERTLQEERLSAGALTRAKWWLFGKGEG